MRARPQFWMAGMIVGAVFVVQAVVRGVLWWMHLCVENPVAATFIAVGVVIGCAMPVTAK